MKLKHRIFAGLLAGFVCLPMALLSATASGAWPAGQAFAGVGTPVGMEGAAMASGASAVAVADSPDSSLFADGTRAINQSRWADAVKIFASTASQHGEHGDGALYWKAYAEDKLGKSKAAEDTCAELRGSYPKSPWIEDCGALLVEIHSKSGKPIQIDPSATDDVKLLALNAMMHQDEPRALAEMQAILNGDASERLKKEAQLILGQHYSDVTYAQVVRIRSVEGDVRVQRGEASGKTDTAVWERAISGLPLETGFSLVTSQGRAEIEFENASTLYLAENSVLAFNDMHETAGIPYTEIALLSGTVSLHIHPYVAGEKFVLRTPTDDIISRYPDKSYARVESFTDATAITPLEGGDLRLAGVPKQDLEPGATSPGRTWTYRQGQLADAASDAGKEAFADWDKWVSDRIAQRDAAISSVIEASGLPAPIPGMAELAGQGKFFECAPYGICWEPNDEAENEDETATVLPGQESERQSTAYQHPRLLLASFHADSMRSPALQADPGMPARTAGPDYSFPCTPGVLRYRTLKDLATGKLTVGPTALAQSQPYEWAVCHAGSWVRHKKHYAWVASCRRRHIDPVRWVKSGHTIAFVPLHPYDVKGQPPINIKHEVFEVSGKNEIAVRPIRLEPGHPIAFLDAPPKEYRSASLQPLAHSESPRMEARSLGATAGSRSTEVSRAAVPLRFDPKSLSFTMQRQETRSGRSETVFAPITNRSGSLQARGESFSGGSGFRSAGSAAASGAGFRGAGAAGNSSFRSGVSGNGSSGIRNGGSSSAGGTIHSGGGSPAPASSSAPSGPSNSPTASSSGAGPHH